MMGSWYATCLPLFVHFYILCLLKMGYRDKNIVGKVWGNILKRGVEKEKKRKQKNMVS